MSFTVWYTKNGTRIPIKMSVLDAFRGVPNPKPRKSKLCPCCGKTHQVNTEPQSDSKANTSKKCNDNDKSDVELTEDDRILIRMKMEKPGRPWQDILDSTNFSDKEAAQARWKEISHKAQEDSTEGKSKTQEQKQKQSKNKEPDGDKAARAAKKKEEGLQRQDALGAGKEKKKKDGSDNKREKENQAGGSGSPKRGKDKPGTNSMKAQADTYDKKKWTLLASKHYDQTGNRITPAQAKEMAESK